jgi:hypothetical protein
VRIKTMTFRNFRRFTDLTVTDIPETARLIVLAGPNGVGKSSYFDGLQTWHRLQAWNQGLGDSTYSSKAGTSDPDEFYRRVNVELHDGDLSQEQLRSRGGVYFRTAYRHEADFKISSLSQQPSLTDTATPARRAVDVDQSVAENYQRLLWQTFTAVFDPDLPDQTTAMEVRERLIGRLRESLLQVFPDLILRRVGGLGRGAAFEFTKGTAEGFPYINLSAGEKAVLDLLLDAVIKAEFYQGAIWCIDEPELHVGTRAQGVLLRQLLALIPNDSQLILASHSLGLMSEAVKIAKTQPGEVAFLDLADHDFDAPVVLRPVNPTREFWQKTLRVALDDMAELVAPSTVIMCEGEGEGFDARCYRKIFAERFPDPDFISAGYSHDAQTDRIGLTSALQTITPGTRLLRLRDRDLANPEEVARWRREPGLRVLTRRHIEAYLFDVEVLHALCDALGKPDLKAQVDQLLAEQTAALAERNKDTDDIKAASGPLYAKLRSLLGLSSAGTTARAFAESQLAPLIRPPMKVYQDLESDIFGETDSS